MRFDRGHVIEAAGERADTRKSSQACFRRSKRGGAPSLTHYCSEREGAIVSDLKPPFVPGTEEVPGTWSLIERRFAW
jgi:hypothetical protein